MNFIVRISEQALEAMALATAEAYYFGDGRRNKDLLETLGYIWGYRKVSEGETFFYLDRMSVSLSARRSSGWVKPNLDALDLKDFIIWKWSPHLTLLGDFHSHPYEGISDVASCNGFEFSDGDFDHFLKSDYIWEKSDNNPIMIAMTIAKLERVHNNANGGNWIRANVWSFDVGEFRFWVNVSVGYLGDNMKRICTLNTHSKAHLDLNTRFFNFSEDRWR